MQIKLSKRTEQILSARAVENGHSLNQYIESLLSRYASAAAQPLEQGKEFKVKTYEDALAWILSRNPDLPTNAPQDTDWQALRAEGRR